MLDVLDSRLLSSGRVVVDNLTRTVLSILSTQGSSGSAIVDSVVSFAKHLPHKHDSLTSGFARLIANLVSSGEFEGEDLRRLIVVHVAVLNVMTGPKVITASSSMVVRLQRRQPGLLLMYADAVFAADLSCNFNALTAMLHYEPFMTEFRSKIISVYLDHVLGGKQSAPPATFGSGFAPLYASLTAEEFNSKLLPVMDRMLKRAQASTIQIIVPLFRELGAVGIDAVVSVLCPIIGSNLRLADARRQKAASELFQILALKVSSCSVASSLVSELDCQLGGKRDGIIANVSDRIILVEALSTLIHSPAVKQLAAHIIMVLHDQAKRETSDEGEKCRLHFCVKTTWMVDNDEQAE